jgi:ADP-ribose pyrophosphatase YjhB (NUDIX family)
LEWAAIPTFDLLLEVVGVGYVFVKRKIAPYKYQWALPGLRMYKEEGIDDTLTRIAKQEVGLELNPTQGRILGQYVGRFKTEHERQDVSTCYHFVLPTGTSLTPNPDHFSGLRISPLAPNNTGAMYRYYVGLASSRSPRV